MPEIKLTTPKGSFRMPNSIVQGLTTTTPANLNRLTPFEMVTLFGLLAHVSSKQPETEVRIKLSEVLEIIRVGKSVTHAVCRKWTNEDGNLQQRRYPSCRRYRPKHLRQVHDALLALHNQTVAIRKWDIGGRWIEDRRVHILDSFGYHYQIDGHTLDVDDLPPGKVKVNIGTDERPIYRIRLCTSEGDRDVRPTAILFRLNTELARELVGCRDTIGFTIFAYRVFDLFRSFMRSPAAIRLIILVLRQTSDEFTRVLSQLLDDLGWDATHPTRAIQQLTDVLERLHDSEIVTEFSLERELDDVQIRVNRAWFQGEQ